MIEIIIPKQQPNLASRENQFIQLQELIDSKRKMLLTKQKKIKQITKHNDFLADIKNDYAKYYETIIKQENEKINALDMLHNYVRDLSTSESLSTQNIKDAKYEQHKIVNEIKLIKKRLDKLIEYNNGILHH
jgi:hypothetical protein